MTKKIINYIKRLEEAGFPESQAYAQVEVFASIAADTTQENVTKQEIARLETDLRQDIQLCESRLELKIDKLDFRVEGLEKRMDGFDKRMDGFDKRIDGLSTTMKWGFGMMLTYLTILISVFQFIRH